MDKKPKKLWKRLLEISVLVATGAYIFIALKNGWDEVVYRINDIDGKWLFFGWVGYLVYFGYRSMAWHFINKSLGGTITPLQSSNTWFTSELARYLPGNVWSFLGRVYLAKQQGIATATTTLGLVIEVLLLVASATTLGGLFFLYLPDTFSTGLRYVGLLALPGLAILLFPQIIEQGVVFLAKRVKKIESQAIDRPHLRTAGFLMLIAWAAYGLGSYFTARSLQIFDISTIWLISVFIAAWLVGYLSFITPMGLGVREGVVTAILAPLISQPVASLIALTTRLWLIVTELSAYGILRILLMLTARNKRK